MPSAHSMEMTINNDLVRFLNEGIANNMLDGRGFRETLRTLRRWKASCISPQEFCTITVNDRTVVSIFADSTNRLATEIVAFLLSTSSADPDFGAHYSRNIIARNTSEAGKLIAELFSPASLEKLRHNLRMEEAIKNIYTPQSLEETCFCLFVRVAINPKKTRVDDFMEFVKRYSLDIDAIEYTAQEGSLPSQTIGEYIDSQQNKFAAIKRELQPYRSNPSEKRRLLELINGVSACTPAFQMGEILNIPLVSGLSDLHTFINTHMLNVDRIQYKPGTPLAQKCEGMGFHGERILELDAIKSYRDAALAWKQKFIEGLEDPDTFERQGGSTYDADMLLKPGLTVGQYLDELLADTDLVRRKNAEEMVRALNLGWSWRSIFWIGAAGVTTAGLLIFATRALSEGSASSPSSSIPSESIVQGIVKAAFPAVVTPIIQEAVVNTTSPAAVTAVIQEAAKTVPPAAVTGMVHAVVKAAPTYEDMRAQYDAVHSTIRHYLTHWGGNRSLNWCVRHGYLTEALKKWIISNGKLKKHW